MSKRGVAILFFSSEADELIHLCDRVAVMSNGSVVETLDTAALTSAQLLRAAIGGQAS